jgi:putative ABC transport system permease protein
MVGTFAIKTRSPDDVQRVSEAIDNQFRNSPQPTKTETESAFVLSFVNQLGNIKVFLMSIAGAVVFTILLVSGNTVAMSVRERINEIGVLKTLGFTANTVLWMIIGEAVVMALAGGVLGTAASYFATQLMRDVVVNFFDGLVMPLWGVPICLFVALMVGLLSSVVPAFIASRTKVADALRHTG